MGAQSDANDALFEGISSALKALDASGVNTKSRAEIIRDLAMAYRFAAGGPQPGGVQVQG